MYHQLLVADRKRAHAEILRYYAEAGPPAPSMVAAMAAATAARV